MSARSLFQLLKAASILCHIVSSIFKLAMGCQMLSCIKSLWLFPWPPLFCLQAEKVLCFYGLMWWQWAHPNNVIFSFWGPYSSFCLQNPFCNIMKHMHRIQGWRQWTPLVGSNLPSIDLYPEYIKLACYLIIRLTAQFWVFWGFFPRAKDLSLLMQHSNKHMETSSTPFPIRETQIKTTL